MDIIGGDDDNNDGGGAMSVTFFFFHSFIRSGRHFVLYRNDSKRTTSIDSPERKVYFYSNRGAERVEFVFILRRINFSITL